MEFIHIQLEYLKPAKYNPRKELKPEDPEYQKIKNSIEHLGYCDPIIINKDLTVIGGHQRLNVLKDLGYKDIDVIQVDLPKDKEKALNVALNKTTGEWDTDKLADLFNDLAEDDFDLELTGFDFGEIDSLLYPGEDEEEKENERVNTVKNYNLELYDPEDVDGFYQMPVIHNDGVIPDDLIGFNYVLTAKDFNTGVHFFVDDYQFERLWNQPDKYIEILGKFQAILSPDFSLYMNMPMAMKVWNIYRSRQLGNYWQRCGIKVIPTISWAEKETFPFCFDGIPEGSIVAVSTIGVKREDAAFQIWKDGMDAMIEHIHPSVILVYGGKLEYAYSEVTRVIYFDNKVTERMKRSKK